MRGLTLGVCPAQQDANSEAAHQEVWLGQQKRNWRDVPSVKRIADGGLSREAEQLLDALFEIDEDKRPTIADVAMHPWLTAPLTPEQEAAWATMQQQQQARQQELARHGWAQVGAAVMEAGWVTVCWCVCMYC